MKLLISITAFLFFGPSMVVADRMIRYIFNSTNHSCTNEDNVKIEAIFNPPIRRNLLAASSSSAQRELNTFPRKCYANCAGVVSGYCHATDCQNWRRNLRSLVNLNVTCAQQTANIDNQLNLLVTNNQVTESCKQFLIPTDRTVSCYDDVVYGVVETVGLWNMSASLTSPTLVTDDFKTGHSICKSLLFNIEAKVNNCVDFVRFTMVGPPGSNYERDHTEDDVPYSLFGDSDTNIMWGKKLYRSGEYTLTIIPDGFESKKRIITFNVTATC